MAESPLATLARLLAGVALVQGRLGHQVLGQLLIANTNDAAIAGAAVVVAGTMKTRNAAAQVALRTAAPAIAVHALLQGEEKRINRLDQLVRDRATKIDARDAKLEAQNHHLAAKVTTLERNEASAQRAAEIEKATLQERVHALEEEKKRLLAELAAVPAAPAQPEPRALRTKKRRAAPRKPASTKRAKRPPKKPGR